MRDGFASGLVRAGLASGMLLLCSGSVAGAAPTITEYPLENSVYPEPLSIVTAPSPTAPSGSLWFTVNGTSAPGFGILSTSGTPSKLPGAGDPRELAIGPEGDLWVTELGEHPQVAWGETSHEPYSAETISLATGSDPVDVARGPSEDMWLTEGAGTGQIVKIDPTTKAATPYSTGLTASGEPAQIVEGSDGDMWFAQNGASSAIGEISPSGVITEHTAGLTAGSKPWGVTLGPDGDVWFTELTPSGKIGRIAPSGQITEFGTGLTKGEPGEITAADNGDLYFTERGGEGAVGQITPTGEITEFTTDLTPKNEPWSITSGPDGNIWFTELKSAKIGKLTISPGVKSTGAGTPTASGVALGTSILANSQPSTVAFEYGLTAEYGSKSSSASVGEGSTAVAGSATLSGLDPSTTYHYRAVAENPSGTTYGPDETFTTASPPPSGSSPETPPAEGAPGKASTGEAPSNAAPIVGPALTTSLDPSGLTPAPPAPPALGHSGVVNVVSGTVLVENPHSGRLERLSATTNIPVGVLVDASDGVLSLTTALPSGGAQTATVWGGSFRFRQSTAGNGMVNLYPSGPVGPCFAHRHRAHASAARASAQRQLWSKDSHGRYTTHGANSAATVLGTEWLTVDSCRGTLTRVRQGKVRVRDLHTHRTVLVRAGHSYLARG